MYTAVIELNSLTDSVGAAAEDHDLRAVSVNRVLISGIVSRVVVSIILCPAHVYAFPGFLCAQLNPAVSDVLLRDVKDLA